MKRFFLATATGLLCLAVHAQSPEKFAADAFVITRMAQKLHVQPRPVDISFGAEVFDQFFQQLDEDRIIFTSEDMSRVIPYRTQLANEILLRKTGFLTLVTGIYAQRISRMDSMLSTMRKQPFNFTADEKWTVQQDTSWPAGLQLQQQKLLTFVKKELLEYLLERTDLPDVISPAKQKALIDSLEPVARKKIISSFQRGINLLREGVTGLAGSLGNLYCEAVAMAFDPHSAYMPRTEKENFESMIGSRSMRFGFSIETDEDGVAIKDLKPGSPAYKSGQLNKGDRIMAIQWEGKNEMDVSEAGIQEVSAILEENNYGKMIMTVTKADGLLRKIELRKETMESDDDEYKVKSFLLKSGTQTIGYISLPAFYTDFDDPQNNVKGCANDVAKAVLLLKKENINGLILDLRYNGGGSMQEAMDLSGIFIDAGPVGQVAYTGNKLVTLKDINRGTVYDGPLLVLVNGASASASEMVAGTLQDYHRAVIMGTPTYGKATSQVIMPLDTSNQFNPARNSAAPTFLKLTIGKLYRITGASAQRGGVVPDIQLPDLADLVMERESATPTSLRVETIAANRFYTPYAGDELSKFVYGGRAMVDTSSWYRSVKNNAALMKEMTIPKDISLRLQDARAAWEKEKATGKAFQEMKYQNKGMFSVHNPGAEEQRIQLAAEMKEMNEQWKTSIGGDVWIATAFKVLSAGK
jgi:carboxyl-terminal processing protease